MTNTETVEDLETLRRVLHAELLRVIQPSREQAPMTWQEFARRGDLPKFTRHCLWKLREGDLKWSTETYIRVAARFGIRTEIAIRRDDAARARQLSGSASRARNAESRPRFGTGTLTTCAA